jgi:predicted transcriptional regulator YdeE
MGGVALNGQAAAPSSTSAPSASATKTVDQAAFSVIGISVHTSREQEAGGNGEIPKLWQRVMQQGLMEQIPARDDSGPVAVYSDFSKDGYTYTLGSRVTSTDKVPDGFVAITIPAGKYAMVTTEQGALPEILPKAWQQIFTMSPAELGGQHAYKVDYEQFPASMDWQNAQVEIYIGLK